MSGKNHRLTALATHKQLLVAESDLNRILLQAEVRGVKQEIQRFTGPIHTLSQLSGLAAQIASSCTGIFQAAFSPDPSAEPPPSSRPSTLMGILRAGLSLWSEWRTHGR